MILVNELNQVEDGYDPLTKENLGVRIYRTANKCQTNLIETWRQKGIVQPCDEDGVAILYDPIYNGVVAFDQNYMDWFENENSKREEKDQYPAEVMEGFRKYAKE